MCGILATRKCSYLPELYNYNRTRGDYSFGMITAGELNISITKQKEPPLEFKDCGDVMYICHTRAPTSRDRGFKYTNAHPFMWGSIAVFHNGILRNTLALEQKYENKFSVDSQWIAYLIDRHYRVMGDIVQSIKETLEEIDGIFGLIIIDTDNPTNLYLARCASTLYYRKDGDDISISSARIPESNLIPEGEIYATDLRTINLVTKFKYSSPYFTIKEQT